MFCFSFLRDSVSPWQIPAETKRTSRDSLSGRSRLVLHETLFGVSCLSLYGHASESFTGPRLLRKEVAVGKTKIIKPAIAVHGVHQNFNNKLAELGAKCHTNLLHYHKPILFSTVMDFRLACCTRACVSP